MSGKPPNLLFIMTDQQRADSLGMIQAGWEVCPTLNRLAAESAVFTRAYNTCPLCVPTRTALATGIYPTRNGVVCNDWRGVRAGDHAPIHQVLIQAGYDVAHVGVDHIRVAPSLRDRVDFALWVDNADYARFQEEHGIADDRERTKRLFKRRVVENQEGMPTPADYSNTATETWPHPAELFKDRYFCQRAIQFLQEARNKPFALFLYLWAPHPPLRIPEPYASMFPPDELELPPNVGIPAEGEPANRRRGIAAQMAEGVSMDQWRRVWAAHLGLVWLADDGIGRVLAALEMAGRDHDTITCFTVDHGDHLGQHRMYQKMEMYEQAVRVPWLVRVPGLAPRRIEETVSHLDVLPTLADLMGLEVASNLDGLSMAEVIRGGEAPPSRPVHAQYSGNPVVGDIRRAVIAQRYKYIHDPDDVAELYDLREDPLEMRNLAADPAHQRVVSELHAEARAWGVSHGDWVSF